MGNVHMEATQINYRGGSSKMNVEDAIKSAIELTPEQKTNINKIPTIEAAVATKTDQIVIAPEFDAESGVYAVGDLVMYEGKLYEFTSAHETAGDWNAEEVSEKTVSDEIDTVKSGLINKQDTITKGIISEGDANSFDINTCYLARGSLVDNLPDALSLFTIYTFGANSTYKCQMAINYNGGWYVRNRQDNAWTAWKSVSLTL